jgi:pilus assembly protein CpaF
LLQLLNTGHAGTLHYSRQLRKARLGSLYGCVLQSDIDLPYRAIKTNIGDSLNVVIHVERRPGRRFISEVIELNGYDPDIDLFNYSIVYLNEGEKS